MPRRSPTTASATRSAAPITMINRSVFMQAHGARGGPHSVLARLCPEAYTPSWWHWIDLLLPSSANSAAMQLRPCVCGGPLSPASSEPAAQPTASARACYRSPGFFSRTPGASAVLRDELDAGRFEGGADGGDGPLPRGRRAELEALKASASARRYSQPAYRGTSQSARVRHDTELQLSHVSCGSPTMSHILCASSRFATAKRPDGAPSEHPARPDRHHGGWDPCI